MFLYSRTQWYSCNKLTLSCAAILFLSEFILSFNLPQLASAPAVKKLNTNFISNTLLLQQTRSLNNKGLFIFYGNGTAPSSKGIQNLQLKPKQYDSVSSKPRVVEGNR